MRPSVSFFQILHKSRTTFNPKAHHLTDSLKNVGFSPSSLLLLSTPEHTDYAIEEVIALSKQHPDLQVIMANTISNHAPSIGELWLSDRIQIRSLTPHNDSGQQGRQWNFITSTLSLNFLPSYTFSVPVANGTELRGQNVLSTMFINDINHSSSSMTNLRLLDISLPLSLRSLKHTHNLQQLNKEILSVTKYDGNVLHQLNNASAGIILMDSLDSSGIKKAVDIFAKLTSYNSIGDSISSKMHKVIAGGGEWGPGADLLVLDEKAQVGMGMSVDLYFVDPDQATKNGIEAGKLTFDQVHTESLGYNDYGNDHVVEDVICFGSETGFEMNQNSYTSAYEALSFSVE